MKEETQENAGRFANEINESQRQDIISHVPFILKHFSRKFVKSIMKYLFGN
jgi:hypothetical protein